MSFFVLQKDANNKILTSVDGICNKGKCTLSANIDEGIKKMLPLAYNGKNEKKLHKLHSLQLKRLFYRLNVMFWT